MNIAEIFASLQGERGQDLLLRHGLATDDFDTMVLVEDDRVHTRSGAALRIARRLRGAWPLLALSEYGDPRSLEMMMETVSLMRRTPSRTTRLRVQTRMVMA